MDYKDQLLDKRWKDLSNKIKDRDGRKCVVCDSKRKLNVHHKKYTGMAWEAPESDLITLCEECHSKIHCKYVHATSAKAETKNVGEVVATMRSTDEYKRLMIEFRKRKIVRKIIKYKIKKDHIVFTKDKFIYKYFPLSRSMVSVEGKFKYNTKFKDHEAFAVFIKGKLLIW